MSDAVLLRRRTAQPLDRGVGVARDALVDCVVLLTAYFVATYLRRELPFGRFVGTNYEWHAFPIYLIIVLSVACAHAGAMVLPSARRPSAASRFWTAIAGIALACVALTAFEPRQSALEKLYFAGSALLLVVLVLPWPGSDRAA